MCLCIRVQNWPHPLFSQIDYGQQSAVYCRCLFSQDPDSNTLPSPCMQRQDSIDKDWLKITVIFFIFRRTHNASNIPRPNSRTNWSSLAVIQFDCHADWPDPYILRHQYKVEQVSPQAGQGRLHMSHFALATVKHISNKHQLTRSTGTGDSAYLHQGTSYQCRYLDPYPDPWNRLPPKFNHLFTCPLRTFPANFMQIRLEVSAQSC